MLRTLPLLALVPVLTLLAQPASALDIDRITVKSQLGQPLLAEISVIQGDLAELDQLQARLASPTTFARIGLARPQGLISDLRFKLVRNARGNPVIRITSSMPVTQEFLTFLVQVDWGDGRLVREYSISLDAPGTLPATALPSIEMPGAAPSNVIRRTSEPPAIRVIDGKSPTPAAPHANTASPIPVVAGGPPTSQPKPRTLQAPVPRSAPVGPIVVPVKKLVSVPSRQTTALDVARAVTASVADGRATEYGPVKSGDTLSKIAASMAGEDYSLNQAMLALLRVNPDAFIDGNINLLRQGAILRAPQRAELSRYGATEAAVMVADQIARWREGRPTQPQPAALPQAQAPATAAFVPTRKVDAPRIAGARLEIAPSNDGAGPSAAAQSGIEPGTSGDKLRRKLQRGTVEAAASRAAEIRYLHARVAELDELQQQQRELIALKNQEIVAGSTNRRLWPWFLAAFGVSTALTWWLVRRRYRLLPVPDSRHASLTATVSDVSTAEGTGTSQHVGRQDEEPLAHFPAWHAGDNSMALVEEAADPLRASGRLGHADVAETSMGKE
jgi:pilus assembly protein FimV